MSVLEEFNGTMTEYEYQKQQERKRERERKRKAEIVEILKDIRTEIETLYVGDVCAKEHNCDTDVLNIIDRKIKEYGGEA